jgi:hypothetical protein
VSRILVGSKLWADIRRTAAASSRVDAAVAFLGPYPSEIFKWPKTTRLLVDLSRACVLRGASSPRGARDLLRVRGKDIKIRSLFGLHAKMLAFDRVAYIGSANLSNSSLQLVEAAVRLSAPGEVAKVRDEIRRLAQNGDRVDDDARLRDLVRLEPKRRGGRGRAKTPVSEVSSRGTPQWLKERQTVWLDAVEPGDPQEITKGRQRALATQFEASGDVDDDDVVQWSILYRSTYRRVPADDWLFVWWKPTTRTPFGQIEGPFRSLGGHDLGKKCAGERWERGEAPVVSRIRSLDGPALRALSSFVPRAARSGSQAHAQHLHARVATDVVSIRDQNKKRAFRRLLASLDRRKR